MFISTKKHTDGLNPWAVANCFMKSAFSLKRMTSGEDLQSAIPYALSGTSLNFGLYQKKNTKVMRVMAVSKKLRRRRNVFITLFSW